jgi:hypothetical protein
MKKLCLVLVLFLWAIFFSSCTKEFPEPVYIPEEVKTEDREKTGSENANGISFDLYNDFTAVITGFDKESYPESKLALPEKYDRYTIIAIAEKAFYGAELLEITLPDSIQTIGSGAFARSAITKIEIPDSVTKMGQEVFDNCLSLEKAVIGKGLREIPTGSFFSCHKLKEISLSEGLEIIGEEAFAVLPALERITLPESLLEIGPFAFWNSGTPSLSFAIPEAVKKIGQSAFRETAWLQGETEEFVVVGSGVLIDYNGSNQNATLPENILYLSDAFAFSEVTALTLNESLLEIDKAAFEDTKIKKLSYEGENEEIKKMVETN